MYVEKLLLLIEEAHARGEKHLLVPGRWIEVRAALGYRRELAESERKAEQCHNEHRLPGTKILPPIHPELAECVRALGKKYYLYLSALRLLDDYELRPPYPEFLISHPELMPLFEVGFFQMNNEILSNLKR